ncbi:MAG: nuclear transport factor 2 family protein [Bacteroidota bacterium]|nr:nuclear transport factor 2 family protein [Bacteroidota bacterium]
MTAGKQLDSSARKGQLKHVVERYFQALSTQNFSAIPYDESIVLRAPLVAGGVDNPIKGKELVEAEWWKPLEPALRGVRINILDHI